MWLKARQHGLGNRPKAVKLVEDIYLLWLLWQLSNIRIGLYGVKFN